MRQKSPLRNSTSPYNTYYSIKYNKTLTGGRIYNFLKIATTRILVSLTALLTTITRLEAKQSSAQSPFYVTIPNPPVGCIFGVPASVSPLDLVFSFIFHQAACLLHHPMKSYQGVNFPYQRFLSAAYLDATELFQSWISEALQSL